MNLRLIFCMGFPLLLAACTPADRTDAAGGSFALDVTEVLGSEQNGDFLRAMQPREFSFPGDHGLHPGYRNEWWYLTGNLEDVNGRRFGYQVTFFSTALSGETDAVEGWSSPRIWMAHAALTDTDTGEHIALERFSRENPGLAGFQASPFKVWLENWSLSTSAFPVSLFPWRLDIEDQAFSLHLLISPEREPVLQGDAGLSRKSPEPGNASYYYSITRLSSIGRLEVNGQEYPVFGRSWLDREWGTSALADDQTGWDWFSLQFNDGRDLMYYRLRDTQGNAHPSSAGSLSTGASPPVTLGPQDISLQERAFWTAPNGTEYTTEWLLQYGGQSWIVRALIDDQFMNLSIKYWEGAVDILDPENGTVLGQGYLEMVRN